MRHTRQHRRAAISISRLPSKSAGDRSSSSYLPASDITRTACRSVIRRGWWSLTDGQYGQSGDRSSQSFSSYSCAHGDDWPRMTEDNELIRRAPVTDRGSIPTDLISFPIERYR